MSADLALVAAAAEDGSPVAVWTTVDGAAVLYLSRERARALTDETRRMLEGSAINLVALREGSAHLALGYAHWHEYVEREFGDCAIYRLIRQREQQVAERDALIASMTLAGYTVREQRDALGTSIGTVHATQRRLGLVPDRPLPAVADEPEPVDPFRGLSVRSQVLARVAAQGDRGLTSLELDAELEAALGTATATLSIFARRGLLAQPADLEPRANRRPYVITERGRARLAEVLAARDAAEAVPVA